MGIEGTTVVLDSERPDVVNAHWRSLLSACPSCPETWMQSSQTVDARTEVALMGCQGRVHAVDCCRNLGTAPAPTCCAFP